MTIVALCIAFLLMGVGLVGCFFDRFPGPLVAFVGLLIAKFMLSLPIDWYILVICAVLVVASMIVNTKYIPMLAKKVYPYDKAGRWGTLVGSLFTFFCIAGSEMGDVVCIVLLFILPFVFAWLFEVVKTKNVTEGTKRGGSAYIVFLAGTIVKLAVVYLCFRFTFENMASIN